MHTTWMDIKKFSVNEARDKRVQTAWFQLHESLEELTYRDRKQICGYQGLGAGGMHYEGEFWLDGNVPDLDRASGYTGVHLSRGYT